MFPETLTTGHRGIWSHPEQQRTKQLVLMLHDGGSTPETVAERYFHHLPQGATGLALQAGFQATLGHNWFTTQDHQHPSFPEVISAAHRVFDALDDDEYGTTSYTNVQVLGVGQGAALATTMLRVRPEALNAVIGIDGYVIDNPMLAALDQSVASQPRRILWVSTDTDQHSAAEFSHHWLTTHADVTEAETTSAITPFLTQNGS